MTTEATTIDCPMCGEEIRSIAKKCKHCGEFLENTVVKITQPEFKECPACGEEIKFVAKKCKHCEEFFGDISKNDNNSVYVDNFLLSCKTGELEVKPAYFIISIIGLVIFLPASIGVGIYFLNKLKKWKEAEKNAGRIHFKRGSFGKTLSF